MVKICKRKPLPLIILIVLMQVIFSSCGGNVSKEVTQKQEINNAENLEEKKINKLDRYYIDGNISLIKKLEDSNYVTLVLPNKEGDKSNIVIMNEKLNATKKSIKSIDSKKDVYAVSASNKYIVWCEASDGLSKDDWIMYCYDIKSEKITEIDRGQYKENELNLDTATLVGPYINISDSNVVWVSLCKNNKGETISQVILYDITLNKKEVLDEIDYKTKGRFYDPQIDNGFVAYNSGKINKDKMGVDSVVYLYNVADKTRKEIYKGNNAGGVAIKYPYVVYSSEKDKLKLYNIETRENLDINAGNYAKWNKTINGEYISWNNNSNEQTMYSINEKQIASIKGTDSVLGGNICDDIFYWLEIKDSKPITRYIKVK